MQGWRLFRHAVLMILQNWQEAVKLLIAPLVIVVLGLVAGLVVLMFAGLPFEVLIEGISTEDNDLTHDWIFSSGIFWVVFLVLTIGAFVTMAGMVVNWHRFVLLEEYPGWWTSPFQSAQLGGYLKLAVVIVAVAIGILIGFAVIMTIAASVGSAAIIILFLIVGGIPAYVYITRMMIALPSQAAGTDLSISEATAATSGHFWTILLALICVGIFNGLLGLVEQGITAVSGFLGVMTSLVFLPFNMLLFASLLTTLYGYFIEKRDLM